MSVAALLGRLRDPLLERDYARLCSRPATFRNRSLAALAIGAVFLCIFGVAGRRQANDVTGAVLHVTYTWLAVLYVWGLATTEAAVAIPSERSTGALTVLLTVPRTPRRLALGFLLSRVFAALTGLLAILPIDGAALLLGGVSFPMFAYSLLLVLVAAFWGGSMGLLSGYGAPSHRHAVGRAAFFTFLFAVLVPSLVGIVPDAWELLLSEDPPGKVHQMGAAARQAWETAAGAFFVATPFGAVSFFTGRTAAAIPWGNAVYLVPVGVTVGLAFLATWWTGARLRDDTERTILAGGGAGPLALLKRLLRRGPAAAPIPAPAPAPAAGAAASAAAPAAAPPPPLPPAPPRAPVRVWDHPLWWKESRPPRSAWQRLALWLGFAGYFCFFAFLFFHPRIREGFMEQGRPTVVYDVLVSVPLWIVALGATASCGTFIAEERERMSLDHLRTAPFTPADFILARTVAVAVRIAPLAATTALFAVVGLFTRQVHFTGILAWAIGFAPVVAFLPLLSFRLGMTMPTARAASRRVGLILGVLLAVWPLSTFFLAVLFRRADDEIMASLGANPIVAVTGPFVLWSQFLHDDWDRDANRFALVTLVALALWGFLAWRLWTRLPAAMERAFHAGEEG